MSLEDKIRKAFSANKVLREASRWDSRTQPNLYALENFLRKSGYNLVDAIEHQEGKIELVIDPIKESHLYPDIVHDIEEGLFYLKVVEHGLLVASDIEEIIKGYTTGLGVLQYLERLKLNTLEINVPDEGIE